MKKFLLLAGSLLLSFVVLNINPTAALADACSDSNDACVAACGSFSDPGYSSCINACIVSEAACATNPCQSACSTTETSCNAACGSDVNCINNCVISNVTCLDACTPDTTPAPVTSESSAIDESTRTAAAGYWFSLVPPACQGAGGCNICQVTLIFTNAANIIGAILSGLSLLMFILGGMLLIFSGGVENRIDLGKKILVGTVAGLAVVFSAWIVVNLIVRLAASSATTPNGLPDSSKAKLFSSDWWNPPACEPAVPSVCAGLRVGDLCDKAGDCASSDSISCSCYRKLDPAGDSNLCGGDTDTTLLTAMATVAQGNKDAQCFCASGCDQYAASTGKAWGCVETSKVTSENKTSAGTWSTDTQRACPKSNQVCALHKSN